MLQSIDPSLPEPDADARAHSGRVRAAIADAIDAHGGFLPFDRYMQIALYEPALGYYVAGARKFGEAGDFVTAPEMTPLFGASLATQIACIVDAARERRIVELGAGSGKLAADVVAALAANGTLVERYHIIEVSPELRERQRETLERLAPSQLARIEWLTEMPATIAGAVVMNEVLDAIPPQVIARRGDAWFERGVMRHGERFQWDERPLRDSRLRMLAAARFPVDGDYVSEINPASEALVQSIGRRVVSGAMLIVDYGFPRAEYYHPDRREGTLLGHYRHRVHADPFIWPGLSDLTAHVDFTAMAEAGERAGLTVAGFTSQAAFLLGCGLLDRLRDAGPPESMSYLREASAVHKLTSPAEMGESFKVLALSRDGNIEWPGFALGDQSHRL